MPAPPTGKSGSTNVMRSGLIVLLALLCAAAAVAQDARVNVEGPRLRAGPSTECPILAELSLDESLWLVGRNGDRSWLLVRRAGGQVGWVYAPLVDPIAASSVDEAPIIPDADALIYGQYLDSETAEHVREIFAKGQALGNRAGVFSKVGDSITVARHMLHPIGAGVYNLGEHAALQDVIDAFSTVEVDEHKRNSFTAISLAAGVGWTTATVLDAHYADPDTCEAGESPLECEYRRTQPSIALIMLGTNDVGLLPTEVYRTNLRKIIDVTLSRGIVPIVSTIPNQPKEAEGTAQINQIIVETVRALHLPLWDYGLVMSTLPGEGLDIDGVHPSIPPNGIEGSADFRPGNLYYGYVLRNLTALHLLKAVQDELNV